MPRLWQLTGGVLRGRSAEPRRDLEDQFGLQYSTDDPSVALSSLQVIIDDGTAATKGDGSTTIRATATVNGNAYELRPADDEGEATALVTLPETGNVKAIYRITGRTREGVPVDATVMCALLTDFGQWNLPPPRASRGWSGAPGSVRATAGARNTRARALEPRRATTLEP